VEPGFALFAVCPAVPVSLSLRSLSLDAICYAALLHDGRYQLRGRYFHTCGATDLEFLDQPAIAATTDLTTFLRHLVDGESMRASASARRR
jgi:hypothetical protein